jgi:hypothetical protein
MQRCPGYRHTTCFVCTQYLIFWLQQTRLFHKATLVSQGHLPWHLLQLPIEGLRFEMEILIMGSGHWLCRLTVLTRSLDSAACWLVDLE